MDRKTRSTRGPNCDKCKKGGAPSPKPAPAPKPSPNPSPVKKELGLVEEVYYIGKAKRVPKLDGRKPKITNKGRYINYVSSSKAWSGFGGRKDNFAVRWTGFLNIGKAGSYRICMQSDDGSNL